MAWHIRLQSHARITWLTCNLVCCAPPHAELKMHLAVTRSSEGSTLPLMPSTAFPPRARAKLEPVHTPMWIGFFFLIMHVAEISEIQDTRPSFVRAGDARGMERQRLLPSNVATWRTRRFPLGLRGLPARIVAISPLMPNCAQNLCSLGCPLGKASSKHPDMITA